MRIETKINKGDEITLNAIVVDITSSGNAIVKLKKGGRILVTPDEIKTIRPYQGPVTEDKRKGE